MNGELKHGVVAVLDDGAGRYLLIRRGLALARAPGVWCFVGGEVEAGESLEAAIEREVMEEVGLRVKALEKIFESISPNGEFKLHWLRVQRLDDATPRPHPMEVEEVRWLRVKEAAALDPILPTLRAWLQDRIE